MPVFESNVEDTLGLWAAAPASAVSFGVEEDASTLPVDLLYRVNLPADPNELTKAFDNKEDALARLDAALSGVPARLDGLVARTQAISDQKGSALSFGALSESSEDELEGDLLRQLADVEQNASGKGVVSTVSYGLGETINDARQRFDELITQIDRDVLHFAWVETAISDQMIARTSVDWSGDAQTIWLAESSDDDLNLHQRNLQFVTKTRALRLRLFVTVASGAARVAGLIAAPGGAVLALPAVYQYVTKILAQTRELQSIHS